jgi:TolA-binding protein
MTKNLSRFIRSKKARTTVGLTAAFLSLAFTIPGCPNVDELNEKISALEKANADQQKAVAELNNQLRTMNDEHNTMKQLVSQISTTVLEQKDAVERIDGSVRDMASRRGPSTSASSGGKAKAAPKKKRK